MYRDTTLVKQRAWQRVRAAVTTAKGIAFDGCHKIYVLMDDAQVAQMTDYGYRHVQPVIEPGREFETLKDWFEGSCGLRFISAVQTVDGDPNDGFMDLIAQGEFDDEED